MKHLTVCVLFLTLLTACSTPNPKPALSYEERVDLYETAIESARDRAANESFPLIDDADDDTAQAVFDSLNLSEEDMSAYAISAPLIRDKAYAVAAIYPAAGKDDAVLESLRRYVSSQQHSFKNDLPEQYEIAVDTRLETLGDGTVLLVMCKDQDAIFNAIRNTIERRK